jgi:hypothetical protein
MGIINPTYSNRVRFKLMNSDLGEIVAQEPIEWESDDVEFARHERYLGMFVDISGTLTFVDDAADYLRLAKETFGVQAKVQLIKQERHPITDRWISGDLLDLDMSTFNDEDRRFSIKILSSGLYELLKNREGDKVELERTHSLDGAFLPALNTINLPLTPRRIFLQSKLVNRSMNTYSTFGNILAPPLDVEINSDQERVMGVELHSDGGINMTTFEQQQFFYYRNDRLKTLKISLDWQGRISFAPAPSTNQQVTISLLVATYNNGSFTFNYYIDIATWNGNGSTNWQLFEYTTPNALSILLGPEQCLAFVVRPFTTQGNVQRNYQTFKSDLRIDEDSFFEPTATKAILTHELGNQLARIITGRNDALYSEALGRTDIPGFGYTQDGKASLTAFTHGMWVRGFDKEPATDITNKYKAFTTSFKDWFESEAMTWDLGLGIEKIGFKERIRIEERSYFFANVITIKLPLPVQNLSRSYDTKRFFSSVDVGYSKGGEYEEAMGLDEYNVKSSFGTIITRVLNILNLVNPFRADSYGLEFVRRKPRINYPNEDTKYDQDIFKLDLKRHLNGFKQRLWQDDFEQEPTGVYSPDTATNLRFSPVNVLLRQGANLAAGLLKYGNGLIRYKESTANSKLKTKLIGQPEYAENGSIPNNSLPRPRHLTEWIEFDHPVDFELMQKIKSHTFVNGKKIQNVYGLIEFQYRGQKEFGFLFNLKPNDKGRFKLLKANL